MHLKELELFWARIFYMEPGKTGFLFLMHKRCSKVVEFIWEVSDKIELSMYKVMYVFFVGHGERN